MGDWKTHAKGQKVTPEEQDEWVQEKEYATTALRDTASSGWGSAELFRQCKVVETGKKYYWNGASWEGFPSTGGAGAPVDAQYVVTALNDGLNNEVLHNALAGAQLHDPKTHTHTEADVTDLDHDAQKIKGKTVDTTGLADNDMLQYDSGSQTWKPETIPGGGDMTKGVYDANDDGVVEDSDKLEASTKAEVQDHTPKAHKDSHVDGADAFETTDVLLAQARVDAIKNSVPGTVYGPENRINFIAGNRVSLTMDDTSDRINVKFDVTGGAVYKLAPTFTIYKVDGAYYAMDRDGTLTYSDPADCANVLQDIIDNHSNWWAHFADGTFVFKQQVDFGVESYFGISGSLGWGTEIRLGANLGNDVNFWEMTYTELAQGRFTLRDLYFNMDALTYSSQDCLNIVGGERWLIDNVKILRPHRDGLNTREVGEFGYTRYDTVRGLQVYYAGRYAVFCNSRDINFFDVQAEYPFDSCFVFGSAGAGNSIFRLHATGAYKADQIDYTSKIGGGNDRRCGLEFLGGVSGGNTCHGIYLDRCWGYGAYLAGSNNALMGGRVYQCNHLQADGQKADVYITGDYNRVIGMELNARVGSATDYGVHLIAGADNNTAIGNICRNHATAKTLDQGAGNEVAHNTGD